MKSTKDYSETFTIVVTDSGLGGLSVVADLEYQLRTKSNFGKINLVFFNALADSDFGYNSMPTSEKKTEVFDSALNAMTLLYNPDMILIACNTLSVVYEQTSFVKQTNVDVLGIIDLGVEMIQEKVDMNPNNAVLLLGTPTTINSLSYHKRLVEKGFKEESIIDQACPLLETAIQQDPGSNTVQQMITEFITDAKRKEIGSSDKIAAALCCTHYGYSETLFHRIVKNIFQKDYVIINPNKKMVDFVIQELSKRKNKVSDISVHVISQVKLKSGEIDSIAKTLRNISSVTASALENYTYNGSLFSFSRD